MKHYQNGLLIFAHQSTNLQFTFLQLSNKFAARV